MPTTKYPNLANDLRKWGLNVFEVQGWQNRSANWNRSWNPIGVTVHHTASGALQGNTASLGVVTHGRPGIPGPLAQILLARNGDVYVIAGHRANHAGLGGPKGRIPKDSANSYTWGIEAENNGIGEKWSVEQLQAYYRLVAALLTISGNKDVTYGFAHKEWAPGRKVDPAGITMAEFRSNVNAALKQGPVTGGPVDPIDPKKNPYVNKVIRMQRRLEIEDDGIWGPSTDKWIKRMRTAATKGKGFNKKLVQGVIDTPVDGDWGPKSRAALKVWVKDLQDVFGVPQTGNWDKATNDYFLKIRNASIK